MSSQKAPDQNSVFRNLPSVDEILRTPTAAAIIAEAGERHTAGLIRNAIGETRDRIDTFGAKAEKSTLFSYAEKSLERAWSDEKSSGIRRVINATGVVIHTNLGRAPLSEGAKKAVANTASGYCTLEYDLQTGKRGRRGVRAEQMLAELTGADAALIVNNCAAAAFFVLSAFATGGEVIISRGELVEIGGDFRVPDVLEQTGAFLREVGTTNRTKLGDYRDAINENTKAILRVHPSNYRIVGFTAMPSISELAAVARNHDILFYEDLGSGALIDLAEFGLADEPLVKASIDAGVDVVTFSGDKLLGGPQAGIIAGKRAVIEKLRKHPLYRALRVDKLAYAALEATLGSYFRGEASRDVPVLKMLSLSKTEIERRAAALLEQLGRIDGLTIELTDGESAIGGGAAAATKLDTKLLAISHKDMSAARIETYFRHCDPPVITRIVDDRVVIDLRTVSTVDEAELLNAISQIA